MNQLKPCDIMRHQYLVFAIDGSSILLVSLIIQCDSFKGSLHSLCSHHGDAKQENKKNEKQANEILCQRERKVSGLARMLDSSAQKTGDGAVQSIVCVRAALAEQPTVTLIHGHG